MTTTPTILVSITDPVLHPEAINIAAATGMDIIDTSNPRDIVRHAPKAAAILVDATTATHAGGIHPRGHLFLLHPEPGPVDWTLAVRIGAADAVILPAQSNKLLATLAATTAAPDSPSPAAAASVIAVTGAVGGAGTSTLAVALALQLHEIVPTVLVDADPVSPGMDLLLGCETTGGIRWADLSFRSGSIAAADLIAALPETEGGLPVLTADRGGDGTSGITEDKLLRVIGTMHHTHCVVVDLPATAPFFAALTDACDFVVLLIPAEVRAAAAASRIAHSLAARRIDTVGVVRHRGWSGLTAHDVADIVGVDVVGELGTVSQVPRVAETTGIRTLGALPRALRKAVRCVLPQEVA